MLDATNAFALYIENADELSGLPEDAARHGEAAEKEGKSGWKVTLHMPSYLPVCSMAKPSVARAAVPRLRTRASEFGKAEWDNWLLSVASSSCVTRKRLLGFVNSLNYSSSPNG